MRLLLYIALAVLVALAAQRGAAQTPPCAGDCDGDGAVEISELVRAVNVALGSLSLTECGAADGDGDGRVEIQELIAAVVRALNGCQLSAEEAAEAAALIASEIVDSVNVFDFGVVGAGGAASAMRSGSLGAPLGVAPPVAAAPRGTGPGQQSCQGGGSITQNCVSEQGVSHLTVDYTVCRVNFGSVAEVRDGRVITRVADAAFCDTREIADGVDFTIEFDRLRDQLLDAQGTVLRELLATLTRSFEPSGSGCQGQSGTEHIDGTGQFLCTPSDLVPPRLACPPEGRDLTATARALTVVHGSQETELGCERRRTLLGRMVTDDAVSGQRFEAAYNQLLVRQVDLDNGGTAAAIDGPARIGCLGDVDFSTEVSLLKSPDDRCPNTGRLSIALSSGSSQVQFGPRDAVAFDYDADGSFDLTLAECEDPALARCS